MRVANFAIYSCEQSRLSYFEVTQRIGQECQNCKIGLEWQGNQHNKLRLLTQDTVDALNFVSDAECSHLINRTRTKRPARVNIENMLQDFYLSQRGEPVGENLRAQIKDTDTYRRLAELQSIVECAPTNRTSNHGCIPRNWEVVDQTIDGQVDHVVTKGVHGAISEADATTALQSVADETPLNPVVQALIDKSPTSHLHRWMSTTLQLGCVCAACGNRYEADPSFLPRHISWACQAGDISRQLWTNSMCALWGKSGAPLWYDPASQVGVGQDTAIIMGATEGATNTLRRSENSNAYTMGDCCSEVCTSTLHHVHAY
jgi:hypothetical protein